MVNIPAILKAYKNISLKLIAFTPFKVILFSVNLIRVNNFIIRNLFWFFNQLFFTGVKLGLSHCGGEGVKE